jgi:murein DD-endopeptidase MepM/ murein hydrolase activator NlpD
MVVVLAGCRDSTGPSAEELTFTAPIVGTPMVDVFYGAYVDHDPGDAVRDYECGAKAYSGHRGVDILLRNFREQDAGVAVIAAARGVVQSVTDGRPDRNTNWALGGGFGNHVVISHGGGITTTYGHLRRGSVVVAPGETVERGAALGQVGSSGHSNWPHLHFEVRSGFQAVEPFSGACGAPRSLWENQLVYQDAFAVTDAGITDQPATFEALLERPATLGAIPTGATDFLYWLQLANQRAAVVRHELRRPGGELFQAIQRQVGPTFSMRYLVLTVPVHGTLTEPGDWEIRTYQDAELVWTQPFTILAEPASNTRAPTDRTARADASVLTIEVLDQVPPSTGAHR